MITATFSSKIKVEIACNIMYLDTYSKYTTVSASLKRHSWLNRQASTLFSKICQLLNVLFNKISPQNPNFFISRRPLICADTV